MMLKVKKADRKLFDVIELGFRLRLQWKLNGLTVLNPETGSTMWWRYADFDSPAVMAEVVRSAVVNHPKWVTDGMRRRAFHAPGPSDKALQARVADLLAQMDAADAAQKRRR